MFINSCGACTKRNPKWPILGQRALKVIAVAAAAVERASSQWNEFNDFISSVTADVQPRPPLQIHLPGYESFLRDDGDLIVPFSDEGGAQAASSSVTLALPPLAAAPAGSEEPVEEPEEPAEPPGPPEPSLFSEGDVDSSVEGGDQTGATVRNQANFEATPLFTTVGSARGGSSAVNFTAPDNLGTFVVRAYASTGGHGLLSDH